MQNKINATMLNQSQERTKEISIEISHCNRDVVVICVKRIYRHDQGTLT